MLRRLTALGTVACLIACWLLPAMAGGEVPQAGRGKVGIGMQAAPFPIFGAALILNPSSRLGLQAIGRVGIDVDFMAFRALARVKTEPKYNVYFAGLAGYFRDSNVTETVLGTEQTDTALGYGVGAGFEYFFSGLPAVGWNLEVDYCRIGFEDKWWEYDYEVPQLIMLGLGIHYYF